MSEAAFERKAEELVEVRRFNRTLSPAINRILRTSDAEHLAYMEGDENAEHRNRHECNCYPRGFVSWSKELKAEAKRQHLEAGHHEITCAMWRDPSPLYSRDGDTMPSSYTQLQRRRDEETLEQMERGSPTAQRRFSQAD
jgi:hypothetical protein